MSPIVDGDDWLKRRLAHLRELLDTDLSPEARQEVELEIALLTDERGLTSGGRHRSRFWRRLRRSL